MKESQLENKTSIATNDYVRMVDENNNSVKIKKDSFMAAIRDALPSIISDGSTGAGSVLSVIGGALKTRTDANLASVLGGLYRYNGSGLDADLLTTTGAYVNSNNMDNMPNVEGSVKGGWGTLVHIESNYRIQIYCGGTGSAHSYWIRFRTGSAWHPWYKITGAEV